MKNKIGKRIVASVMLSAFALTNLMTASIALDGNYGYDYMNGPALRGSDAKLGAISETRISNANSVVNLSLREADIQQVLRMFADQAGMNIIFAPSVTGTVTMDLVDIPLQKALDLVVQTNNLYYDIQANTLVVSSKDDAVSVAAKSMSLIPVRYVNASSIASFLNSNIFNKDSALNPGLSTKPVVTVNPATNDLIVMGTENDAIMARKIVEQFDKKPTITTFKVNHTTPAEMADLICNTLLPSTISGGGATGGAASIEGVPTGFASDSDSSSSSSSGGSGGGSIAVGGGTLVCSIDAGSASGEGLSGLDLKTLSVSYFPTQGTVQIIGGSPSQIELIKDYVAMTDKKSPQAYLEVQIISLSESGSKQFSNTWQFMSHNFSFNAGGGTGFKTAEGYPIFFAGKGFSSTDSSSGTSTTSNYTKWSTSPQLIYMVNYLVENSKGRVLANPRVLLTSGQESSIELTSDYVTKVTTQYLDSTSGSGSSQVQRDYDISDDNGITINITPFISPDGYVTLDIAPEYSDIKEQLYSKGVTGEDELSATLLFHRNLDLKGVRIKDGETLVIGGMIKENESKTVSKIPFLGDIPVLGMFFRSTSTRKEKEEMVIMLTPQIVIDTEDAVGEANVTL